MIRQPPRAHGCHAEGKGVGALDAFAEELIWTESEDRLRPGGAAIRPPVKPVVV